MSTYEFLCDPCRESLIFTQSITADLPNEVKCPKCGKPMYQNFEPANIIFRGSWPGKDIKVSPEKASEKERDEKRWHDVEVAQKEADEVLAVRRKGRRAYNEFAKHNPQRIQRYNENMRNGIKGR